MKILIIGGTGTIGKKVSLHLSQKHEVIAAGRKSGDYQVEIADSDSIKKLFQTVGQVDAVLCIAGEAKWAPFSELGEMDYYLGIRSKLMGQVNVARIGQRFINENGSCTLSTGILADDPVVATASAAMVNGALHSFVKAAALEMTNGHRVNVVALGLVEDSAEKYGDFFPGHNPISMDRAVNAYVRSVEGRGNGEIIRVYS